MIGIIAKLPIKEGKVDEAIAAFKDLMAHVAKEEGTLFYTLNRDQSDPNLLVVMERYKDQDALKAHSSAPHFKDFSAKISELLAGKPEITRLEEIHAI